MRKYRSTTAVLRLIITTSLSLAFLLSGCASNDNESNNDASDSDASSAVYLPSERTLYSNDGSIWLHITYEYDDAGNVLSTTDEYPELGTKHTQTFSEYDSVGCYGHMTNDDAESSVEWEIQDGRPVKMTILLNGYTAIHEYDDSGRRIKSTYNTADMITETCWDYTKHIKTNTSMKSTGSAEPETQSNITWEVDNNGVITSYVNKQIVSGKDIVDNVICECDENGNIVRQTDTEGNLVAENQYVRIDNPSMWAWILAQEPLL